MSTTNFSVGVIGSGAMGTGIAQVAAMAGHNVIVYDNNPDSLTKSKTSLATTLKKLEAKGKIENAEELLGLFSFENKLEAFADCGLIIEAIVEKLEVKKAVFADVENLVSDSCILATNTSSLSVTSIAAACKKTGTCRRTSFLQSCTTYGFGRDHSCYTNKK